MKLIVKVLGGLLVLLVVVAGAAFIYLDRIVEKAVETAGPQITGTPVTLEQSALKPWSGAGKLSGLALFARQHRGGSGHGHTSGRCSDHQPDRRGSTESALPQRRQYRQPARTAGEYQRPARRLGYRIQ